MICPCLRDWGQAKLDTAWRLLGGLEISPSAPVHNFWQRSARAFRRAAEPASACGGVSFVRVVPTDGYWQR